ERRSAFRRRLALLDDRAASGSRAVTRKALDARGRTGRRRKRLTLARPFAGAVLRTRVAEHAVHETRELRGGLRALGETERVVRRARLKAGVDVEAGGIFDAGVELGRAGRHDRLLRAARARRRERHPEDAGP